MKELQSASNIDYTVSLRGRSYHQVTNGYDLL